MKIISESLRQKVAQGLPFALELGAGSSPTKGYFHLDLVELPGIDVVADLNQPLDGFPDAIVNDLHSWHTLEHVANFLPLMAEIHRICTPDARIEIVVPHHTNVFGFSDPTHVRFFGLYTMAYFVPQSRQPFKRKVQDFYSTASFDLLDVKIEFYRSRGLKERLFRRPFERFINRSIRRLEFYEQHLARFFPARQIVYVMRPAPIAA